MKNVYLRIRGHIQVDLLFLTPRQATSLMDQEPLTSLGLSNEVFFCIRCIRCPSYFTFHNFDEHMEFCSQKEAVMIEMPEEGTTIVSKNMIIFSFAIYSNFKCFTKKLDTC